MRSFDYSTNSFSVGNHIGMTQPFTQTVAMAGVYLALLLVAPFCQLTAADVTLTQTKFKAAVYEHRVVNPRPPGVATRAEALRYMMRNVDIYKTQAVEAKAQGADILVFPEDGIYGLNFTRESIYNYLEQIPEPLAPAWSPCNDPDLHQGTEILRELSCIARNNSMFLVANMGDKQPCNIKTVRSCPEDGRYQFNTNVAFDPNGTLVARYHKHHLFVDEQHQFNAADLEVVYFDTPFGRFGLMICFDIFFSEPGLSIVLKHKIANIAYPVAWYDNLPLLSALGFHSSFARGLGINLLAANAHAPDKRMYGSGVYSPDGMKAFYYDSSPESLPKLLIAELDVLSEPKSNIEIPTDARYASNEERERERARYDNLLEPDCDGISINANVRLPFDEFYSYLLYDKFTFKTLKRHSGGLKVCQNAICCHLHYSLAERSSWKDLFAFGAFDGLHTYEGHFYFQICALVKCTDANNRTSCGSATDTSTTWFSYLNIRAELSTPFIYPQIVLSDGKGELLLANSTTWGFKNASLWTNVAPEKPILSAALFGRYYQRDNHPTT
ncbi:hypothetical protein BsWGS_26509 [Bradybaena similaris]